MQGIVLYADGGARPTNPGYAGAGVHGYIYDAVTPTKGIGLGSIVATSLGYLAKDASKELLIYPKADKTKKKEAVQEDQRLMTPEQVLQQCQSENSIVTTMKYVDMFCPIGFGTNNLAELFAVIRSLHYIKLLKQHNPDFKLACIISDSDLTVEGINSYLVKWAANGYRKADGSMVANHVWWQEAQALLTDLRQTDLNLVVKWTRAHVGEHGNERVDALATMAVYQSYRQQNNLPVQPPPIVSEPEGYWKTDIELHPFFQHRCIYFNSGEGYHRPGYYNTGNHGKDDDLLGNRQSDGCYSHIRLNEPEKVMEKVVEFAQDICFKSDNIWIGYINRISSPVTREAIFNYGADSIDPMSEPHVGYRAIGSGKEPVMRMQNPPQLANRAAREVTTLSGILDIFLSSDRSSLTVTDVTDQIYDIELVKDKKGGELKKYTIKASLPVGIAKIVLPAKYVLAGTQISPENVQEKDISFTSGIDILNRNGLKRLEELNPCIYVVTWSESSESFRYATVITTDNAVGIWGGVYSNLFFVVPGSKKKG